MASAKAMLLLAAAAVAAVAAAAAAAAAAAPGTAAGSSSNSSNKGAFLEDRLEIFHGPAFFMTPFMMPLYLQGNRE